jgi:hypothetical protein
MPAGRVKNQVPTAMPDAAGGASSSCVRPSPAAPSQPEATVTARHRRRRRASGGAQ